MIVEYMLSFRRRISGQTMVLTVIVCIANLLNGCVANRSYRRASEMIPNQLASSIDPSNPSESDCSELNTPCVSIGKEGVKPQHFYLSYIEFDDMGELWSIGDLNTSTGPRPSSVKQSQLELAVSTIRRAKSQAERLHTELVVISFIHGWHNNASQYDEQQKNLGGFKSVLQRLSFRGSVLDDNKPPVVVGIFIAWRGQVIPGDVFSSYWNRRDAANVVGGPSMTEVITRLMFETKGASSSPNPQNRCRQDVIGRQQEIDSKSRFLIIGHSFGARILEDAIGQPMLAILLERQSQAESCVIAWNQQHQDEAPLQTVNFKPPADLVVFLNAANGSLETKSIIEAFKRSHLCGALQSTVVGNQDGCRDFLFQGPLMISITSQGDWATGKVMPLAQTLSIPWKAFRRYDPDACGLGELGSRNQTWYFRHNDGNVPEMQSHEVQYVGDVKLDTECGKNEWPYFTVVKPGHLRCFRIMTLAEEKTVGSHANCPTSKAAPPWNNTPFYVMRVPSTLIADHNDIFQDGTIELLNTIVDHYILSMPGTITAPAPSPNRPFSKTGQ